MLTKLYDPHEIEARTPSDRDRTADLLRTVAILMVVLGHWLVATILYRDGQLVVGQVLQHVPETQLLTWIFQVMPLFFFIGGHVNAGSWERCADTDDGWALWLRRRARRLLAPLLPVLLAWIAIPAVLSRLGMPDGFLSLAARYALLPLWFLVVYLLVIGIVPITYALHRRFGAGVLVVTLAMVVVVEALTRAGVPAVGFLNYLLVWGGIHQLGYFWHDDRLPRRTATCLGIAAGAAAVAAVLVLVLDYPVSMVAVQGAPRQNTDPPNTALLVYAIVQLFLVAAARDPIGRWLERPRVWAPVVLTGSITITLFLWHMTALVVVAMATHLTGIWPRLQRIDGTWWALRPVWLLLCAVVLAVLVAMFRGMEDQPDPVPDRSTTRALLGLVAFATGMGVIATVGIHTPERPANLPLGPLALIGVGLASLGVLRPRSWMVSERSDG
jgi:peptidoglycan/LPS O-acetylase OafA/YrhL